MTDLTIQVLREIRDEVKKTNERLDQTNERLDALREETNGHFEETSARFDELGRRIVDSEIRTATALTDLAGTVREMTSVLRVQGDLRPRLEKCEQDIAELKRPPRAS